MNGLQRKPSATSGKRIRVSIIEDHAIVRAGIHMLVEREPGIEVAYEAATATEALASAPSGGVDVILLDLSLRNENGLDFLPKLVRAFSPARVLVLTAVDDIEVHLRAVQIGASGVVMKEQAPEILVEAIKAVHSGESWIGQALSKAALIKLSRTEGPKGKADPDQERIALLTPREREVITVVARGYNGARIAEELHISEATVRHHLTSILSKLEVSNKLELAVYAFHHGLSADSVQS